MLAVRSQSMPKKPLPTLIKNAYTPGQWYTFFYLSKNPEQTAYYNKVERHYSSMYSSILMKDQIHGKILDFLSVPNYCGKTCKAKLKKIHDKESSSRKKSKYEKLDVEKKQVHMNKRKPSSSEHYKKSYGIFKTKNFKQGSKDLLCGELQLNLGKSALRNSNGPRVSSRKNLDKTGSSNTEKATKWISQKSSENVESQLDFAKYVEQRSNQSRKRMIENPTDQDFLEKFELTGVRKVTKWISSPARNDSEDDIFARENQAPRDYKNDFSDCSMEGGNDFDTGFISPDPCSMSPHLESQDIIGKVTKRFPSPAHNDSEDDMFAQENNNLHDDKNDFSDSSMEDGNDYDTGLISPEPCSMSSRPDSQEIIFPSQDNLTNSANGMLTPSERKMNSVRTLGNHKLPFELVGEDVIVAKRDCASVLKKEPISDVSSDKKKVDFNEDAEYFYFNEISSSLTTPSSNLSSRVKPELNQKIQPLNDSAKKVSIRSLVSSRVDSQERIPSPAFLGFDEEMSDNRLVQSKHPVGLSFCRSIQHSTSSIKSTDDEIVSQASEVTEIFTTSIMVDLRLPGAAQALNEECKRIFENLSSQSNLFGRAGGMIRAEHSTHRNPSLSNNMIVEHIEQGLPNFEDVRGTIVKCPTKTFIGDNASDLSLIDGKTLLRGQRQTFTIMKHSTQESLTADTQKELMIENPAHIDIEGEVVQQNKTLSDQTESLNALLEQSCEVSTRSLSTKVSNSRPNDKNYGKELKTTNSDLVFLSHPKGSHEPTTSEEGKQLPFRKLSSEMKPASFVDSDEKQSRIANELKEKKAESVVETGGSSTKRNLDSSFASRASARLSNCSNVRKNGKDVECGLTSNIYEDSRVINRTDVLEPNNIEENRVNEGSHSGSGKSRKHVNLAWKLSLPHISKMFFNEPSLPPAVSLNNNFVNYSESCSKSSLPAGTICDQCTNSNSMVIDDGSKVSLFAEKEGPGTSNVSELETNEITGSPSSVDHSDSDIVVTTPFVQNVLSYKNNFEPSRGTNKFENVDPDAVTPVKADAKSSGERQIDVSPLLEAFSKQSRCRLENSPSPTTGMSDAIHSNLNSTLSSPSAIVSRWWNSENKTPVHNYKKFLQQNSSASDGSHFPPKTPSQENFLPPNFSILENASIFNTESDNTKTFLQENTSKSEESLRVLLSQPAYNFSPKNTSPETLPRPDFSILENSPKFNPLSENKKSFMLDNRSKSEDSLRVIPSQSKSRSSPKKLSPEHFSNFSLLDSPRSSNPEPGNVAFRPNVIDRRPIEILKHDLPIDKERNPLPSVAEANLNPKPSKMGRMSVVVSGTIMKPVATEKQLHAHDFLLSEVSELVVTHGEIKAQENL